MCSLATLGRTVLRQGYRSTLIATHYNTRALTTATVRAAQQQRRITLQTRTYLKPHSYNNIQYRYQSSSSPAGTKQPYITYHSVVVTLAGPDRSGIVSDLSQCIHELQGNIEESRMTILGNDFAVILLTSLPQTCSTEMVQEKLKSIFTDFIVSARPTIPSGASGTYPVQPVKMLRVALEGPDQPGVVRALTELLFKYGASIRDLDTDTSSAPFAGYRIFSMKAIISIPTNLDLDAFHNATEEFQSKYGFQLELSDPNADDEEGMDDEYDDEEDVDTDNSVVDSTTTEPKRTVTRTLSPLQQKIAAAQQKSPADNTHSSIQSRLAAARDKRDK